MGRRKHKDNKLHSILTLLLILCLIITYINLGFAIPNTFAWAEAYIEAEDTDNVDIED
jgi:hypothetical protein